METITNESNLFNYSASCSVLSNIIMRSFYGLQLMVIMVNGLALTHGHATSDCILGTQCTSWNVVHKTHERTAIM